MGRVHTAVVADGELFTFGRGGRGQLGHGDPQSQQMPKKVAFFGSTSIEMMGLGGEHTAVVADGE